MTIGSKAMRSRGFGSRAAALVGAALALLAVLAAPVIAADAFRDFLESLWPDAQKEGVSRATFDAAFRGLTPDYSLPDLIIAGRKRDDSAGQAEFTKSALEYLNPKYLGSLAVQGRKFLKEHEKDILNIEKNTGVDRYIMVAIWGRETAYGTHKLPHDAIRVLATQAFTGRRKDEFRLEILAALKMLQAGVPRAKMRASWAGAVGLTQFMPTEYFKHLEDGDGDGKVDIFDSRARCARLCRASAGQQGLGARPALGLRGQHAAERRLLARGPARRAHHRRMAEARLPAHRRQAVPPRGGGDPRLSDDAVGRLRAGLPCDARTSRSSASTTPPISTPCSSATSPTASPAPAASTCRRRRSPSRAPRR